MSLCLWCCCFLLRLRWSSLCWLRIPTANCDTVWTEKKVSNKGGHPMAPSECFSMTNWQNPPAQSLDAPWTTGQLQALSFGFLSSFAFGVLLCDSKFLIVHSVAQQLLKQNISRWFLMSLCLCRCCFLLRLRWSRLWWLCLPTANCDTVWTEKKVSNKGGHPMAPSECFSMTNWQNPPAQSLDAPWTTGQLQALSFAFLSSFAFGVLLCDSKGHIVHSVAQQLLKKYLPLVFNVTLPLPLLLSSPASMKQILLALPSNSQLSHSLNRNKSIKQRGGHPMAPSECFSHKNGPKPPEKSIKQGGGHPMAPSECFSMTNWQNPPEQSLDAPWTTGQLQALSFAFLSSFAFGVLLCDSKGHIVHSVAQQLLKKYLPLVFNVTLPLPLLLSSPPSMKQILLALPSNSQLSHSLNRNKSIKQRGGHPMAPSECFSHKNGPKPPEKSIKQGGGHPMAPSECFSMTNWQNPSLALCLVCLFFLWILAITFLYMSP